jgi:hypothetical protein
MAKIKALPAVPKAQTGITDNVMAALIAGLLKAGQTPDAAVTMACQVVAQMGAAAPVQKPIAVTEADIIRRMTWAQVRRRLAQIVAEHSYPSVALCCGVQEVTIRGWIADPNRHPHGHGKTRTVQFVLDYQNKKPRVMKMLKPAGKNRKS